MLMMTATTAPGAPSGHAVLKLPDHQSDCLATTARHISPSGCMEIAPPGEAPRLFATLTTSWSVVHTACVYIALGRRWWQQPLLATLTTRGQVGLPCVWHVEVARPSPHGVDRQFPAAGRAARFFGSHCFVDAALSGGCNMGLTGRNMLAAAARCALLATSLACRLDTLCARYHDCCNNKGTDWFVESPAMLIGRVLTGGCPAA